MTVRFFSVYFFLVGFMPMVFCGVALGADNTPSFMSPYGQIQNVQNYSSNPFWSQNGGWRQNMPVPVYVTGPDVSTSDCMTAVSVLISSFCDQNNNCDGMRLADVRPAVVLALSRMPGHNFATSCIGYIDSEFDNYMKRVRNNVPTQPVAFPGGAVVPNSAAADNTFRIELPQATPPQWQTQMQQRQQALKQAQSAD